MLLFDYRGYGRSTGSPSEEGTYRDARAARKALPGESARDLPRGVARRSGGAGAGARVAAGGAGAPIHLHERARHGACHYPFIPAGLVPDAYPSIRLIEDLKAPLLVLHGERDDIVPLSHGQALFDAAPEPKQIRTFPDLGHNDLVPLAGKAYAEVIAAWARRRS